MGISVDKTELRVKGKMVNIGVDVHKRSWRVTALVEGVFVMPEACPRHTRPSRSCSGGSKAR
jgi:hypothetical protein